MTPANDDVLQDVLRELRRLRRCLRVQSAMLAIVLVCDSACKVDPLLECAPGGG
jgi:hypothetical protein